MVTLLKSKNRYVVALIVCLLGALFLATTSFASSYVLTATVPYEIPTVSSVVDTVGITTSDAPVAITGICGIITPSAIVSLWNGGSLLGATTCQFDGTFSLTINLQPGVNSVVPKTSNIANVYGPEGQAVQFIYNPPPAPQPPQPAPTPTSAPSATNEKPASATPALQVSSPQPFGILSSTGEVSIDITVQGGDTPYEIVIKWGDGKSDSKNVSEPGTYTFSHVYKQKNSYKAEVKVKDKSGNTSDIFIPFSDVKGAIAKKIISEPPSPIIDGTTVTLSVLAVAALLSITAIGTFALGHLHQIHIHNKKSSIKIAAKKKKKKSSSR